MKSSSFLKIGFLSVLACGALLSASAADAVTLNFWFWNTPFERVGDVIAKFEQENPGIKIEYTNLESKNFQEKVPLALSTGEDLDIVGVQAGAFGNSIKADLADVEPLMAKYIGADWAKGYSKLDIETSKATTGGTLKFLSACRFGAMMCFYNPEIFRQYGLAVPKTFADFKKLADTLKVKNPSILPCAFNGKDGWTCDEIMLTIMGQTSDYYNQWLYKGAKVDDRHFIDALSDTRKFFDAGIFSKDVMDFDYGRAQEMFATGKAATYIQGSWQGALLSDVYRKDNKIDLKDVGAFALPVVRDGGKASLRSYLDQGVGVAKATKHPAEAAKFLNFWIIGEGADMLYQKGIILSPSKLNAKPNLAAYSTRAEKDGLAALNALVGAPTADRNNVSGYSDVEGASVQKVILGSSTAEAEAKALQKEWTSGKYAR
jgi:raffinose/stachyose/melibiose transport system substrate-binding protein